MPPPNRGGGDSWVSDEDAYNAIDPVLQNSSDDMRLRRNPKDAPWVVQKFGGTSIGKFAESIALDIVGPGTAKDRIAIVCSARSTGTKDEGTTSRLLRAASSALTASSNEHVSIVDDIRADHNAAAAALIRSADLRSSFAASVDAECVRLLSFLSAAQVLDEISPKTQDVIIGAGEKLSCLFMTALLQDRGIAAEYVNLENIIPTSTVCSNTLLSQEFYESVGKSIFERVQECEDRIPVITGFFGTVPGSIITAIGRGYTDLCAALLAVAAEARELQIWKEVDGIFTADPRKVPSAQLIPIITPEETAELTYRGSEVIHEMTMDHVIRHRIPIRIKNVMNPTGSGTVVFPHDTLDRGGAVPGSPGRAISKALKPKDMRPTAVTTKHHITVINIRSNRKSNAHGFLASVFTTLHSHQIPVDLISTSEVHVSLAVHTPPISASRTLAVRAAAEELKKFGSVDIIRNMTILAVIGAQMKNMMGIAGRIFKTLGEEGVNIEMISQGSDEINISCVVREEDAIKAMTVLHTRLFLYTGDE